VLIIYILNFDLSLGVFIPLVFRKKSAALIRNSYQKALLRQKINITAVGAAWSLIEDLISQLRGVCGIKV